MALFFTQSALGWQVQGLTDSALDPSQSWRPASYLVAQAQTTDHDESGLNDSGWNGTANMEQSSMGSTSNDEPSETASAQANGSEDQAESEETASDEEDLDDDFDDDFGDLEEEFAQAEQEELYDPLEGYNRAITTFNDKFYFWLLDPIARGYRWLLPESVRLSIVRFFNNLNFPLRFANNLFQLKFKGAAVELGRFTLNSTVGIAGFFDPAKSWFGLETYDEDFGQTLGHYGVGTGFHIVLPILGPSNLRDTLMLPLDWSLQPLSQIPNEDFKELSVRSFDVINETSTEIGEYDNLKKDAFDLYPFLRDVYEQNRNSEIEK